MKTRALAPVPLWAFRPTQVVGFRDSAKSECLETLLI